MVSQTPNEEWDPPGGGVSAVRTPPSYLDAVRSRHSLSQSEQFQPGADGSLQYNSLPRPLPQRFQTCPTNGVETKMRGQWQDPHHYRPPMDRDYPPTEPPRGFQVYSKPPGPANHVPLVGSNPGMSKTSSLPRCFPRNPKLTEAPSHFPNEFQQPLSIIVQQNDQNRRHPIQHNDKMPIPQDPRWMSSGPNNRQLPIHHQPSIHREHNDGNIPQSFPNGAHDARKYPAGTNGHHQAPAYYHQPPAQYQQPPVHYQQPPAHYQQPPAHYQQPPAHYQQPPAHYQQPAAHYQQSTHYQQPPAHYQQPPKHYQQPPTHYQQQPQPPKGFKDVNSLHQPRYSRGGTMHSSGQRRDVLPEPAISLRTGPLGSYPDSMTQNSATSPPPSTTSLRNPPRQHDPTAKSAFVPLLEVEQSRNRDFTCIEPMSSPTYPPCYPQQVNSHHSRAPANRNSECPLYENREEVLNGLALQKSSTLPTRRANSEEETSNRRPILLQQSPLKNGGYHSDQNSAVQSNRQYCLPMTSPDVNRFNEIEKDFSKPPTPRRNNCQTPEEAGLVMIVESRDLNSQVKSVAKDVVKPRPRIPISPSSERGYHTQSYMNGGETVKSSVGNGDGIRSCVKPMNGHVLRRTPLSSSTASLNSEISSVSSRNKTNGRETAQRRLSATNKSIEKFSSAIDHERKKKKEISPSPWTREEKEKLQKKQMEGARRVRDGEIEHLQTLPDRTSKQDEWLRILLLEREFQRRAEEVGDDDEDEEDETLLERAENRERMLIMEREKGHSFTNDQQVTSRSGQKNITSSSDHWLMASQAKQRHRSSDSGASSHNMNASFEVEQLNDLLETMNMSPVSRQDTSLEDTLSSNMLENVFIRSNELQLNNSASYDANEATSQGDNHNIVSPVSTKSNSSLALSCADFCYPVEQLHRSDTLPANECPLLENLNQIYQPDESLTPGFVSPAGSSRVSSQRTPTPSKIDKGYHTNASSSPDSATSEVDKRAQYKSTSNKHQVMSLHDRKDCQPNAENGIVKSLRPSKLEINGKFHKNPYYANDNDRYVRNRVVSPTSPKPSSMPFFDANNFQYPVRSKISNDFQKEEDLEDKSPEYKKIWTSKPEKLTFLDKIKKFSLQAGEDDIPRDKVKNSRAQRELEIKFNGDPSRIAQQASN